MCGPLVKGLPFRPQTVHGDFAEHLLTCLAIPLRHHTDGVASFRFSFRPRAAGLRSEGPRMNESRLVGGIDGIGCGQSAGVSGMGVE